ncbi:SDR family oxidoreductase [Deinococcus roseus]|uniref:dTDP-4-dehydrorhamnose reductase n=1 Tax=Deinococcus roseus TaxID=392414 RepID=A0ABQ2D398_9DEIO|nr:NAD(P)-dependent oxidoreductase [Deinococcus roseus]GGJ35397.1 dTDP-4-rhamnose reductase [Deinococcus roseus]
MTPKPTLLVTGGTGRMGKELLPMLTDFEVLAPGRSELDLLNPQSIRAYVAQHRFDVVLHLAAYTDVAKAEKEQELCYQTNVLAVRHLAQATRNAARFVHISTDYVFDGERGNYQEDEVVNPSNQYSLSKALGEEAARAHPGHLIVRTSFKMAPWPYPRAFSDQYTSADHVDVIARELLLLLQNLHRVPEDLRTLHVGTERKSIFDLAKQRTPAVTPMSRLEAPVHIPPDVSLNTERWEALKASWM